MLIVGLAALAMASDPRPNDDALRAAVVAERPGARVLSLDFRESNRGGARIGCGLIEADGVVEPVSVVTSWQDRTGMSVTLVGAPPRPPETPHWEVRVIGPTGGDPAQTGEAGRNNRNRDVLERRMARMFCPDLAPPDGAIWATELEPHPDPARAAEARRRAQAATDLLFGPEPRPTQPDR